MAYFSDQFETAGNFRSAKEVRKANVGCKKLNQICALLDRGDVLARLVQQGRNAADFEMAFDIGAMSASRSCQIVVVVSNDVGFRSALRRFVQAGGLGLMLSLESGEWVMRWVRSQHRSSPEETQREIIAEMIARVARAPEKMSSFADWLNLRDVRPSKFGFSCWRDALAGISDQLTVKPTPEGWMVYFVPPRCDANAEGQEDHDQALAAVAGA